MSDTSQGEQVAAVVDAAIVQAEEKIEAAEAVAEALTEAAIRDRLSGRIDDCEEEIDTCQNALEKTDGLLQSMEQTIQSLQLQVTQLSARLETEALTTLLLSLIPQASKGRPKPSENNLPSPPEENPDSPKNEEEGALEGQKTEADKPKRGRLL